MTKIYGFIRRDDADDFVLRKVNTGSAKKGYFKHQKKTEHDGKERHGKKRENRKREEKQKTRKGKSYRENEK